MQFKTGTELFWNFYSDIKRSIFIIFCIINDCCLELCILNSFIEKNSFFYIQNY